MEMRVVVVGAGIVGQELAERLAPRHQVMLVDNQEQHLQKYGQPIEPGDEIKLAAATGIRGVHGDGTSRLVLKRLHDPEILCSLVAVAGADEDNLEAGKLARTLGFDPVIALLHQSQHAELFRKERITTLHRSQLLADEVERSLHYRGAIIPRGIGLGQGELVEIRLLRSSPVLSRPLKTLGLHRWRIAAIFRGGELIVPTGDSTLQVDDRVLLVGEPKVLMTVTEYLRRGTPQFPHPFGANVVTLEWDGTDNKLAQEAELLAQSSTAAHLVRGAPNAEHKPPAQEREDLMTRCDDSVATCSFALPPLEDPDFDLKIVQQRAGVIVTKPRPRSMAAALFGLRGEDAQICDRTHVPVLFARGSFPFRRILLPVSYTELNIGAAEMAIDITRQLGASLTAINVDLPRYISGIPEEALHEEVVPIRRLCELYEVPLEYRHREGNPVRQLLLEAQQHDLVVVTRRLNRRDTFFRPDVALRVARAAKCSVIVLTMTPGG